MVGRLEGSVWLVNMFIRLIGKRVFWLESRVARRFKVTVSCGIAVGNLDGYGESR